VLFQVLDKFGRTPEEVSRQKLGEAGIQGGAQERLFSLSRMRDWTVLEQELTKSEKVSSASESLFSVKRSLDAMGLGEFVDFDFTIVRGLAYYTGTVFELFDAGRSLRAIAGGGRYDGLLNLLGGVDLPAIGFAIGDVVLGELLKDRGLAPPTPATIDVFVAGVTEDDLPHVLRVTHQLRDAGIRVEYALKPEALGKQLKLADSREAVLAVVIGPDDRAKGEVQLKELRNKAQHAVKNEELIGAVKKLTANG
jgi:histidyl-tRNA synthetase